MHSRSYYWDLLNLESPDQVPEAVSEHITKCRHCQAQISRLQTSFAHADSLGGQAKQRNSAVTTLLRLHLAYAGRPVTCSTIKAFLPSLALADLKVKIPSPITAHLACCRDCSDDLLTITGLGLTCNQLYRLGLILTRKPSETPLDCSQARLAIPQIAAMDFDKTDSEVLRHLCTCSQCRKMLYQHRQEILTELPPEETAQKKFLCEKLSAGDIFDYCFPCGIDSTANKDTESRQSLALHLRTCPTCLTRMQDLHTAVSAIAERPDSNVVTCFTFQEQTAEPVQSDLSSLYPDWPVIVQILDKSKPAASAVAFAEVPRKRAINLSPRQLLKPAVAAAAVILMALGSFFYTPSAAAVTLSEVCKAIVKIQNIHITGFIAGKPEPVQKEWLSRTLRVGMFESREQFVLWDIPNKISKTRDLSSGSLTTVAASAEMLPKIQESIVGLCGLVPFSSISDVPRDSQWISVDDANLTAMVPGTVVYDLTWTKTFDQVTECCKLRFFINTATDLPKRIEYYSKSAISHEYTLESVRVVTYPPQSEIEAVLHNAFD